MTLGLGGFLGGSKFDSFVLFGNVKKVTTKVSKECVKLLESNAAAFRITVDEYVKSILEADTTKQ
jgi:hypothetical protein